MFDVITAVRCRRAAFGQLTRGTSPRGKTIDDTFAWKKNRAVTTC